MARVSAILAMGGKLAGTRYLSARMIDQMAEEQVYAEEVSFFGWMKWGLGVTLDNPHFPLPSPSCLHWGGLGGSFWVVDPRAKVSCAYTPNNFCADGLEDLRNKPIRDTLRELLPTL
jgi:CubicO group peptidase (beta-lactamase class C family)